MPSTKEASVGAAIEAKLEQSHAKLTGTQFIAVIFPKTKADGRITTSAHVRTIGYSILGPSSAMRDVMSFDEFVLGTAVRPLVFDPFRIDPATGLITKHGSLVNVASGIIACTGCENTVDPVNGARRKRYTCDKCGNEMRWVKQDERRLTADAPFAQSLYKTFKEADTPLNTEALYPRVWAVYPGLEPPATWLPPKEDRQAMAVAERCAMADRSVLPISVADQVQQDRHASGGLNLCKGLIMDKVLTAGFATKQQIFNGGDVGYKVRLWGGKPKMRRNASDLLV